MSETITFKDRGLKQMLKAFKGHQPVGRIGIIGTEKPREPADGQPIKGELPSNATIGAAHEFGTSRLPRRSFLREPLAEQLEKQLKRSGAFKPEVLNEVLQAGDLTPWMLKVMASAESVVGQAFDTGGFGKWPASDMTRKTNWQTLVETHQLRDAISSDVK